MMLLYETLIYILIFFLGAALASFYNASIYRIENELKYPEFLTKGSFCEKCKKKLKWYELIPVFGYLIINGKCQKCSYKVSPLYPISEAILGLSMVMLSYYDVDMKYYVLLNMLFFLAIYDFQYKGFPKRIMHAFLFITGIIFIYEFFFSYDKELLVLIVSLSIATIIAILNLFKRSFGTGDLLVILMISFIVTLTQFVSIILFSILLAGIFSIILLATKKVSKKDAIPFVPFIFLSYLLIFPLQHYIQGYFTSFIYLW